MIATTQNGSQIGSAFPNRILISLGALIVLSTLRTAKSGDNRELPASQPAASRGIITGHGSGTYTVGAFIYQKRDSDWKPQAGLIAQVLREEATPLIHGVHAKIAAMPESKFRISGIDTKVKEGEIGTVEVTVVYKLEYEHPARYLGFSEHCLLETSLRSLAFELLQSQEAAWRSLQQGPELTVRSAEIVTVSDSGSEINTVKIDFKTSGRWPLDGYGRARKKPSATRLESKVENALIKREIGFEGEFPKLAGEYTSDWNLQFTRNSLASVTPMMLTLYIPTETGELRRIRSNTWFLVNTSAKERVETTTPQTER